MPEDRYVRPALARARLENPNRPPGEQTESELEVMRISRGRIAQERKPFQVVHYQYDAPFFYPNFRVELGRPWENATNRSEPDVPEDQWGELSDALRPGYVGSEFNPDGVELD